MIELATSKVWNLKPGFMKGGFLGDDWGSIWLSEDFDAMAAPLTHPFQKCPKGYDFFSEKFSEPKVQGRQGA